MTWWLVWLQPGDEVGVQTMDTDEIEAAIVVQATNEQLAEDLARIYASGEDFENGEAIYKPETYKLLRVAEATVGVK